MTTQDMAAVDAADSDPEMAANEPDETVRTAPSGKSKSKASSAKSHGIQGKPKRRRGARPGTKAQLRKRLRRLSVALMALGACLLVALAAVVWLATGWSSARDQVHSRQVAADNVQHAEQLASDYTRRALNYSFQNPDQYLAAITRDASPTLAGKFNSASDLIKGVITEAHVVASGTVLSTALESVNANNFHVIVVGQQTSQNDQNQQPITTVTPLRVGLSRNGAAWTVTEFGPMDSNAGGIPGAGAAPAPSPTPAGGN